MRASAPSLAAGLVKFAVDKVVSGRLDGKGLTEEEVLAETDKSPGVLIASGYIAGGALAGILLAISAVYMKDTLESLLAWFTANNPFFEGPNSDWLAMIPFIDLKVFLYFVGRGALFNGKPPGVE
ncbi:MAG TPA: hypothetical protein VMM38_14965 [Aridibacter sp.]|nr:hypothetical protein [Aridibacter sp.]